MAMTLKEISGLTKIPVKVLVKMKEDGVFTEEMNQADQDFFDRLLSIIRKRYFIRHCLMTIRTDQRENFIATSSLETKWERYLYTHMVNHYGIGNKIVIPDLVKHAEKVFNFEFKPEHIEKVKKIRNTIYQKQSRHKLGKIKKNITGETG